MKITIVSVGLLIATACCNQTSSTPEAAKGSLLVGDAAAPAAERPGDAGRGPPRDDEVHQTYLTKFQQETTDATWSAVSAASFRASLERNAAERKLHYRTAAVECRSTLCKATLEWANWSEARKEGGALPGAAYEPNCVKAITLFPPTNPDATYQATLFLDCTELRSK